MTQQNSLAMTDTLAVVSDPIDTTITIAREAIASQGFSLESLLRGLLGVLVIVGLSFLLSRNKKAVDWKQVGMGVSIQIILALCILFIPFIGTVFEVCGKMFVKIMDFTKEGSEFLFGGLLNVNTSGYIFVFQVLPTIIFFSALTSLLYYYNVIQRVVVVVAWLLKKSLRISGPEGLTVAGNIFLGQTEAPLMIKKFMPKLTLSETFLVMVAGMATIAGGVLAAYIGMLGGDDPVERVMFAKHLLTASVMAAPGAIVISKILMPQTETFEQDLRVASDSVGTNALDALTNGTSEGVKLVVNVAAMLLVIIALVAFVNYLLGGLIGHYTGLNGWIVEFTDGRFQTFSLEFILGMLFTPLTFLFGVPTEDIYVVAGLLGKKLALNEFVAYADLATMKEAMAFTYEKSIVMVTYMLCGFANLSSVGICIGGIGALAPNHSEWFSKYATLAMVGGALASCLSATIVGMILG